MRFAAVLVGVLLLSFAVMSSPRSTGETFGANVRVNQSSTSERNVPVLAVGWDGTVYAAWQDRSPGHWRIMLAHQPASGGQFTGHVQVASSPPSSSIEQSPDIGFWNNTVCVVWQDNRNGGNNDIYFTSLSVPGGVPNPEMKINDEVWAGSREAPSLAVGPNGTLFVAYSNESLQIRLVASYDGGATWSPSAVVSNSTTNTRSEQRVAVDRHGKVYVVWRDGRSGMIDRPGGVQVEDDDVYMANSTDGGRTFGPDAPVNDVVPHKVQSSPTIAIDGNGRVHVAWKDERLESNLATDIFYANSDDGRRFGRNVIVNDTSPISMAPYKTTHQEPWLAVDPTGTTIYIVWVDDRALGHQVYLAKSTDGGLTFRPANIGTSGANFFIDDESTFNGAWDAGEATILDNGNDILDAGTLDGTPDRVIDAGRANLRTDWNGDYLRYHDKNSNGAWDSTEDIVFEGPVGSFPHIDANILAPWDNSGYTESQLSLLQVVDDLTMRIAPGRTLAVGGFDTATPGLQINESFSDASLEIVYSANASYTGSADVSWAVDGGTNHTWFQPVDTSDVRTNMSVNLFSQGVTNVSALQNLTVSFPNVGLSGSVSFDLMVLNVTVGIRGIFDRLDTVVYRGSAPTVIGDALGNFSAPDRIVYMDVNMTGRYEAGDPVIRTATVVATGGDLGPSDEVLARADAPSWKALLDPFPLNDDHSGLGHYMPRIVLNPFNQVTAIWQDLRQGTTNIYSTTAPTDVSHGPYMAFWFDTNQSRAGPGGLVHYKMHVRNIGGVAAMNVSVRNTLATGLEFVRSDPAPDDNTGGVYTWQMPFVSSLGFDEIAVEVRVNASVPLRTILPARGTLNLDDLLGSPRPEQFAWLDITAADLTLPVILHTPPSEIPAGSDFTFSATVTDPVGVSQVRIFVKPVGASYFNSPVQMGRVGNTSEYAVTYQVGADIGVLEYYIEAVDSFGNVARSPSGAPGQAYRVQVTGGIPIAYVVVFVAAILAVGAAVVVLALLARRRRGRVIEEEEEEDREFGGGEQPPAT